MTPTGDRQPFISGGIEDTSTERWTEESPEARHGRLLEESRRIADGRWPPGTVMLLPCTWHIAALLKEIARLEADAERWRARCRRARRILDGGGA